MKISVIVPTHNRRALLERKLRALERELGDFEIIVVADGCADGTLEFLQNFGTKLDVQVLELPGLGAAAARNAGVQASSGRVLLFSDDDVIPRSGWVLAHANAHTGNSRAEKNVVAVGRLELPAQLRDGVSFLGPKALWWNATGANSSMSRDLFDRAGGYDEAFREYGGEDPDLGFRLLKSGANFVFLDRAVAEHWDEGFLSSLRKKARAAGIAHVRVWRKNGDARIAWALGVHPVLLGLKRVLLPVLSPVLGSRGVYEREYARGARDALRGKA
jgi:glycosyltransferase involved in cell wall biosynthesis